MKQLTTIFGCLILIIFACTSASGQKEGNVWYFGLKSALQFNAGAPLSLAGSEQNTFEGCASICDANGNPLFYTNGGGRDPILSGQTSGKIWNGANQLLYDMGNTEGGGFSAAQSSVFIPKPGVPGHYYLFTMEEIEYYVGGNVPGQPLGRGLSWFELDANANGGQGAVVDKQMMLHVPSYEGLCAVRHANGQDYWILITDANTGALLVYLVSSAGIQLSGTYGSAYTNAYIKGAPNGKFLALSLNNKSVGLLAFDNQNGVPQTPVLLPNTGDYFEFSPNSRYLYAANNLTGTGVTLLRYDLNASNVPASRNEFATYTTAASPFVFPGQMQVAPDHKIYFVVRGLNIWLSAIACPNGSNPYVESDLFTYSPLNNNDFLGLPNFDNAIFKYENNNLPVDAGPAKQSLCGKTQIDIDVNAPGGTQYTWSDGISGKTRSISQAGVYIVTVTDPCGASGIDTVTITPGLLGNIELKQDSCSGSAQLTAKSSDPGAVFVWENGSNNPNRTVSQSGTYSVSISNSDCSVQSAVTINIPPIFTVNIGPDTTVRAGQTVKLNAIINSPGPLGPFVYAWTPVDGSLSCSDCPNPIATINNTVTYVVKVSGQNTCIFSDSITITVDSLPIFFPNAFTPNGDGTNDVFWLLGGRGDEVVRNFEVYNRWGNRVFRSVNYTLANKGGAWNGKDADGVEAPTDVYYWVAEILYKNGKVEPRKGQLTLIR